jgi:hypothetical protein
MGMSAENVLIRKMTQNRPINVWEHHHHCTYQVRKLSADSLNLTVHNSAIIHSCRCAGVQTMS